MRPHSLSLLTALTAVAVTFGASLPACASAASEGPAAVVTVPDKPVVDIDADPVALLPAGPLAAAYLDGHAFATSTVGGDLVSLGERVLPFANEIDFHVARDLGKVWVASYSFTGADALAVVTGAFQPDKIDAAAKRGMTTSMGTVVVSTYAGRRLFTVANMGFTLLSSKTALVGTEAAIRRALDRVQAGTLRRELPGWMGDWVLQDGYPLTIAGDVTRQSFGKTVTGMLPWVQGMKYVRARGRFNDSGSFGISGALTFPDAGRAQAAAQGLSAIPKSFAYMTALKMIGLDPIVRNVTATAAGSDVQFQTVVDEKGTRQLVRMLGDLVGQIAPAAAPSTPAPTPPSSGGGTTI